MNIEDLGNPIKQQNLIHYIELNKSRTCIFFQVTMFTMISQILCIKTNLKIF